MRTIFCSAVFVSITLFGSTTLTQTQPENAKRFFPSAVGNKWHWLDETGGSTFYREIAVRAQPVLASFVDVPTMADGVNDDCALVAQDLEDDPIRTFSNLVETLELPFEGK